MSASSVRREEKEFELKKLKVRQVEALERLVRHMNDLNESTNAISENLWNISLTLEKMENKKS
jgi:ATP-dependent RNA circularization protein (DNA/RNA ligase family)